jgi:hypothetical protein
VGPGCPARLQGGPWSGGRAKKFTHEAMCGPSAWLVADRELMAAYVSKANESAFCVAGDMREVLSAGVIRAVDHDIATGVWPDTCSRSPRPASDLARCTGKAGDAAGALDQLAALLPVEERVLGPEHPDTLATRHDLAHWTIKADGDG